MLTGQTGKVLASQKVKRTAAKPRNQDSNPHRKLGDPLEALLRA